VVGECLKLDVLEHEPTVAVAAEAAEQRLLMEVVV